MTGSRAALLGLYHEANTFSGRRADLDEFEPGAGLVTGDLLRERFEGTQSTLGGYLAATREHGITACPLAFARVNPMGPITRRAADHLLRTFLDQLRAEGPWDTVLLAMHGAGVIEGEPDADGLVVSAVRHEVGPDVPIGVVLDMHANPSARLIEAADVVLAYQTNPHLDAYRQATAVTELIARIITGDLERPHMLHLALPLAVNILRQYTDEAPMKPLLDWASDVVATERSLLALQVIEGYQYADVPTMGMSVLALGTDSDITTEYARRFASRIWAQRDSLQAEGYSPADAIRIARAAADDEVLVLLDVGDNIGAGAPGDSTQLFHTARELGQPVLLTLHDPESVEACRTSGTGTFVHLRVGGKKEESPCPPVEVSAKIVSLSDGKYHESVPTHGGFQYFDAGPTATLVLDDGTVLVVTSHLVANTSLEQYRAAGVELAQHRVIIAKGVNAPRAAYSALGPRFLPVATDGVTTAAYTGLTYRHRRVPMYPFESAGIEEFWLTASPGSTRVGRTVP